MDKGLTFFEQIASIVKASSVVDIIDILLVAFLIYNLLRLVRETRAVQLLKGIILLVLLYFVAYSFRMKALPYIMEKMFTFGAWALIVVFQPELRRALEQVGRTKFSKWVDLGLSGDGMNKNRSWENTIDAIGDASVYLSKRRIGALMVLERQGKLGEIVKSGTIIDATPSSEILGNIFFPNSPLHDGALIIRDGRLHAAGCFLPLSENYDIS
ncbi:MAG: diadenylate cyclase, partial [Oscillospiraceae bacterium]